MGLFDSSTYQRIVGKVFCIVSNVSKESKMRKNFIMLLVFGVVSIFLLFVKFPLRRLRPRPELGLGDGNSYRILSERTIEMFASKDRFKSLKFDAFKNMTFVILHIQKTGGTTFEKLISSEIQTLKCNCSKLAPSKKMLCDCSRSPKSKDKEVWLICRYTNLRRIPRGWPCGVHPGWTELQSCIPKITTKFLGRNPYRNFIYITQLRDPVNRLVSEFLHVQRGATWKNAKFLCKGHSLPLNERKCYQGEGWVNVTFKEFLSCKKNFAFNRQTRMLANLEFVGCYNLTMMSNKEGEIKMLKSAMLNLVAMPFFGLMEYPAESQFLFEKTFKLKFAKRWALYDSGYVTTHMKDISSKDLQKSKLVNHLDIELYGFAKLLFFKRLEDAKKQSGEQPQKTFIVQNSKGKTALRNNWKRVTLKRQDGSRHVRRLKKKGI